MKIFSDFSDFYDKELEASSIYGIYRRMNGENMSRKEALDYLREKGIRVIDCDYARNIRLWRCTDVVVYLDSNKHGETNKEIVSKETAMQYYPNNIVTPYIPRKIRGECTLQYIRIGKHHWNLIFMGDKDTLDMGNLYSVEFLGTTGVREDTPIWSIDYVKNEEGAWVAVDYNDNPNIEHMTCRLKPEDVVKEMKWYCGSQEE